MKVTFDECKASIREGVVCSYCGGSLEPIETVDNAGNPTHWVGCRTCCKFDFGVPKPVFDLAKELNGEHERYGRLVNVVDIVNQCYRAWVKK